MFQVLDENEVLVSGLEPESIPENNEKSNYLLSYAKEIDHYEIIEESPDLFIIYLLDDSKREDRPFGKAIFNLNEITRLHQKSSGLF